jgi:RsiW-degrading membrane proteinase PrsW (M82 family)
MTRRAVPEFLRAPDFAVRTVLIVAAALSFAHVLQFVIDISAPRLEGSGSVGLLNPLPNPGPRVMFWCLVVSWIAVLAVLVPLSLARVRGVRDPGLRARRRRFHQLVIAAALVAPFSAYPLMLLFTHVPTALICLPSTAFGVWAFHRMQRYRRIPVGVLGIAFAWGLFVATGAGGGMNLWVMDYANRFLMAGPLSRVSLDDPGSLTELPRLMVRTMHEVYGVAFVSAGLFEELAKGAGIAVVYLLFRRYFDNAVSGIVIGAVVGLGFNLSETVEYMSASPAALLQYWFRQSAGLMGSHTAFSAVAGAGFGVASGLREARYRRSAIVCGFLAAIGGHFLFDASTRVFGAVKQEWFGHPNDWVDVLLLQPLMMSFLFGPFILMYALLVRRGLRDQAGALAFELPAEAATGAGAITAAEVRVLLEPPLRLWLKVRAFRQHGLPGYRALTSLHAAQFDLGVHRWHRATGVLSADEPDEAVLRNLVLERKYALVRLALPVGHPAGERVPT